MRVLLRIFLCMVTKMVVFSVQLFDHHMELMSVAPPPKLSNEKLRSSHFVNKNKETPNKTPSEGFMSSQLLLMDSHVNANTWNHFTRVSSLI